MRLPLSTWAWFITSCIGLMAFAVLLPACVLLILDRVAGTSFFIPSGLVISDQLQPHSGGSTLLWQHLFWFFGHPEVYIAIVPGIGHRLACPDHQHAPAAARPRVIIGCMVAIGVSELHGLGTSHVRQRHEPVFVAGIFVPDADHHDSRDASLC